MNASDMRLNLDTPDTRSLVWMVSKWCQGRKTVAVHVSACFVRTLVDEWMQTIFFQNDGTYTRTRGVRLPQPWQFKLLFPAPSPKCVKSCQIDLFFNRPPVLFARSIGIVVSWCFLGRRISSNFHILHLPNQIWSPFGLVPEANAFGGSPVAPTWVTMYLCALFAYSDGASRCKSSFFSNI